MCSVDPVLDVMQAAELWTSCSLWRDLWDGLWRKKTATNQQTVGAWFMQSLCQAIIKTILEGAKRNRRTLLCSLAGLNHCFLPVNYKITVFNWCRQWIKSTTSPGAHMSEERPWILFSISTKSDKPLISIIHFHSIAALTSAQWLFVQ